MPSKTLDKFLSNYGGLSDLHLFPLRMLKEKFKVEKVLYPGSWIHLTPSLVFPFVVYVDNFSKMESMFKDSELIQYILTHSEMSKKPTIKYHKIDYQNEIPEKKKSFDLLISLSSGFVSQYCGSYLRENGLLFVNNEHFDATKAFVDEGFSPIGIFSSNGRLIQGKKSISEYFKTRNDEMITLEMVLENSKRSPSKVKYKLKKNAPFYLFIRK